MDIAAKIRELRVANNWSQEQMAQKLSVSRQAITKWETGAGAPDIENLVALAQLFGITTDELLLGLEPTASKDSQTRLFESITMVDTTEERHYDIAVGCARSVTVRGSETEKVLVKLTSSQISNLEKAFKVTLDTQGRSFDIAVESKGIVADSLARKDLDVLIELPKAFSRDAEIDLLADELLVEETVFDDLEVDGKVGVVRLTNVEGHIEFDTTVDMEIWAQDVKGKLDINQIGATSVLHIAHGTQFAAASKGLLGKRKLVFTQNGEPVETPVMPEAQDASLVIELAGSRCELTVDMVK